MKSIAMLENGKRMETERKDRNIKKARREESLMMKEISREKEKEKEREDCNQNNKMRDEN